MTAVLPLLAGAAETSKVAEIAGHPLVAPIIEIGLAHYLVLAAAMFALGVLAVVARRNAIGVLIGIELILNSANVNLVAFGRFTDADLHGPVFAVFVVMLAAAEAAIALALLLNLFERTGTVSLDEADGLKG